MRVVRAFGQEGRHRSRFAELNDEHREANMKTVYLNAAYFPAVELLSAVATAAILIYGGNQVLDGGGVTIGVLASFVFYLQSFFDPIQSLSQLYTTYQAGMALDKIFELLDERPDIADADDAIELRACAGDQLRGRDVLLRRRRAGARPRDAGGAAGQTLALVGATGAGKSTLAKLVARFYDPGRGRVLIDGHDLRDVTERSLRSQLGIVPQESFLFSARSGTTSRSGARTPRTRMWRGARPSAPTSSSSACRRAMTPRWANAAGTCRRGSASWWRSRAPRPRTRGF